MRISDWSSDVCSSDLRDRIVCVEFAEPGRGAIAVETLHDRCAECAGRVTGDAKASAVDTIKERVVGCDRGWITAGAGMVLRGRLLRSRSPQVGCIDPTSVEHPGVYVVPLAAPPRLPLGTSITPRVELGRAS